MLAAIDANAGLWEVNSDLVLPLGFRLPLRMTVVRLPDGALWLHSPVPLDDTLARAVAALGPVRHIVAPNLVHYFYLAQARERFPEARVYATAGLRSKRPRLPIDQELEVGAPEAWGGAIEVRLLAGAPRWNEAVFLHAASATLLCSDLLFNLHQWNRITGMILRVMGTRGGLRCSRLLHTYVRDRAAFRASVAALGAWSARRILVGHGDVYESAVAMDDLFAAVAQRFGPIVPARPHS